MEESTGTRKGQYSSLINHPYRVCFLWTAAGPEQVEIGDYHQSYKQGCMIRIPPNRTPTHPGEMLFEEFLRPVGLTQRELAEAIFVPCQRVNDLVNGRRGMTPSTARRLARFFGNSPASWMNLQWRWDLYFAQQEDQKVLEGIHPHHFPAAGG